MINHAIPPPSCTPFWRGITNQNKNSKYLATWDPYSTWHGKYEAPFVLLILAYSYQLWPTIWWYPYTCILIQLHPAFLPLLPILTFVYKHTLMIYIQVYKTLFTRVIKWKDYANISMYILTRIQYIFHSWYEQILNEWIIFPFMTMSDESKQTKIREHIAWKNILKIAPHLGLRLHFYLQSAMN